jgi:hypothetical protein
MRKYSGIIDGGIFGPSGDSADRYQERPADPDLCTIKGYYENEGTTRFALGVFLLFKKHIWHRIFSHRQSETENSQMAYANLDVVQSLLDYFMCVFLPLLLTAALYALYAIRSTEARIAVIGGFGVLVMMLLKVTSRVRRSEMYAFCAAYFAVASVFVTIQSTRAEGCQEMRVV